MFSLSVLQVSHDFAINFSPDDDECEGKTKTKPIFILEIVNVQDGQIKATVIIEWLFLGADLWEINFL